MIAPLSSQVPTPPPASAPDAAARRSALLAEVVVIALLTIALIALFAPMTLAMGRAVYLELDHNAHERFAQQIYQTHELSLPHFLYHLNVIGLYELTGGINWRVGTALAMTLPHVALGLIGYVVLRLSCLGGSWGCRLLCATLSVILVLAVPPFLIGEVIGLAPVNQYLIGYITPTVYHNPTYTLLRPLALLLFGLIVAAGVLASGPTPRRRLLTTVALAVLVFLNGVAKPSFLIVLLPVLALWSLARLVTRRPIAWAPVVAGVAIPGLIVLGFQYVTGFTDAESVLGESSIVLAPLEVLLGFPGMTPLRVLAYLLLSLLPPGVIFLLGGRAARADVWFRFAWVTFLIGTAYLYLLMETGWRSSAANFAWSAYAGVLMLYFASFRFVALALTRRITPAHPSLFRAAAILTLFLTLAHGLLFYVLLVAWLSQLTFFELPLDRLAAP